MAQPSRKDALNLARSFIITEADEDSDAEDFKSDDEHYDQSQQQEEDLRRQKAESIHLCARNYDLFAEICDRWSQQEAQPRPFKVNALSQLNDYDSDSDSDKFVPPTASPAPPAVISSVSAPPAVPPASAGPPGAFSTAPMEAWVLLDKYLTSDSGQGGQVHATLEKLCIGAKWDDMWGRITGMEPGDEDAATAVRNALDSIKPTVPGPTLLSDCVDSAHLEDLEVGEGEELTEEQKELAEYLNKFSDSVMLEEYGINYVRCRAFPSRKQGGLYVWVRSMLDANYILAAYFCLTDGFLYSRQPVFSYAANNTRDSIARKDNPGFTVPLLWKGPYLTMPIHHRITGMRKFPYMAKLPPFQPGVWVIAKKGLYQGDTGVIMMDTSSDYSTECVVAFLPRLDLPQQKFKRVKKTHSSNPAVPATFTTPFPVSTTMSDIKSKFDFVSINTKAGYPIPLERTVPSKKSSVPSARHPHPSKVCIGLTPVLKFAKFHDIPPSSILVCCAICDEGATCEHGDKEYALLKQTIWQGLSLHLDIRAWPLCKNPELASELGLQSKDEGFIRDVVEINCVVEFLDGTDSEGRQVVLPQHSLLQVMRQGDEVYVCQASRSIFQLGVAEVSSTTERIPLDGKVGLIISIGNDGETVQVQFSEYPVPQQFHSNSLVNSALMLLPNDLVKRGIKKPLPLIDPVFSVVPKTLVYVEPNPSILTTNPAPEPLDLAIHTGHRPWVGKEHHKAENGSMLDVNQNDSMSSGLAITVRLYSGIDICVDYSRVFRFNDGKFLHDNGPHKLLTYDPHYHFKPGYQPQYTQSEILKGYAPMDMSAWQATYQDHWVGSGGNNGGTEGGIDEMQASSSSFDSGPASGSTTRSIASGFASPDGCMSPDSSLNSLLQPYKCWWVDVPGTITVSDADVEEQLLNGSGTPLRLVPATPFPDFTNEILDPRIQNALPRQQLLLDFRGETKDRVITLKEGPGGQSTLYYKQKGTGSVQWVLQVVRLEPQETRKIGCTVPRFTEIVEDREPPIVVLESSIALVNQMPDEQGNGIRLMEERQLVAENEWVRNGCPELPLTDSTVNLDSLPY
ncbi:hypothetical protein BT96DRAFT_947830 [Gymnopus androsaceus JB14]|uniref:Uncharacterized protein n=1 Tax=Gymnopus androsaceus JB14 TaxID=1447944 RepID=A0A6A4GR68_9AGAR|nr:hypothetical protein BT96DRAFT_947830 [Gymnopus androsaceus JB14]